jgi:hypothetical protein
MSVMHKCVVAVGLVLAISACKKKEEAPMVEAPTPAPMVEPAAAPPPPPVLTTAPVPAEIMVSAVALGSAIGTDNKVTEAKTVFGIKDQIYVAVDTKNAASNAELKAKWTFEDGQVVNENTINFAPQADTTSNFKITNPKEWPVGKYKVEITLNGKVSQTVDFEVKK